jgi:aryl-alcohol dehydrogenase-like predicted oxidoreductase
MRRRQLGRSGLYVSEFTLGTMTFGMPTWGADETAARAIVARYLDAGGTSFDTADCYYDSEEILGRVLTGMRDDVVIATKVGLPLGKGEHERGTGRKHIQAACESSLRRLQTDHIDLYWIHVDDTATPLEETVAALDALVRAGKVLYTGLSNMRAYRVMKALATCDRLGAARFIAFQGEYNLIVRTLEREHFPLFAEEGVGFLSWSPLAGGMLTGKMSPQSTNTDTRLGGRPTPFDSFHVNDSGYTTAATVSSAATRLGCTPAQLALAWQRTRSVTSVILGARTVTQLKDNLGALEVSVPEEIVGELDKCCAPTAEYPAAFVDLFQPMLKRGRDD